jgi:hypothetical protein
LATVSSWLNRAVAVPIVGFAFDPIVRSSAFLIRDLEPLAQEWASSDGLQMTEVEALKIRVDRTSGIHYTIDQHNIVVGFGYPVGVTEDGRQIALIKVGEKRAFTDLLTLILDEAAKVCSILAKKRPLQRIGVVANVKLPADAPPPGVEQYLKHLGQPWGAPPSAVVSRITASLGAAEQCHHQLQWQTESSVMQLSLDWQRRFDAKPEVDAGTLRKWAVDASESALKYFDKFGEGDLHYVV